MTNKNLTFNTLDSYFLNTGNMRLNIGYFRDCIMDQFDIVQRHTNGGNGKSLLIVNLENSRRSIRSLVWAAFVEMTNGYIEKEKAQTYIKEQLDQTIKDWNFNNEQESEEHCITILDGAATIRDDCDVENWIVFEKEIEVK